MQAEIQKLTGAAKEFYEAIRTTKGTMLPAYGFLEIFMKIHEKYRHTGPPEPVNGFTHFIDSLYEDLERRLVTVCGAKQFKITSTGEQFKPNKKVLYAQLKKFIVKYKEKDLELLRKAILSYTSTAYRQRMEPTSKLYYFIMKDHDSKLLDLMESLRNSTDTEEMKPFSSEVII